MLSQEALGLRCERQAEIGKERLRHFDRARAKVLVAELIVVPVPAAERPHPLDVLPAQLLPEPNVRRSEERRVGKECRL